MDVLNVLPRYLVKDTVVAVGEVGYDCITPAEDMALSRQLDMAAEHGLPALVHAPHRDKLRGVRRSIDLITESGFPPERTVLSAPAFRSNLLSLKGQRHEEYEKAGRVPAVAQGCLPSQTH
jgi:predicted metal-dependent TIM-barrel fold hydrolase